MGKTYQSVKCFSCKHEQDLVEHVNIYQDITGKHTICEKCNKIYGVEPIEL